MAEHSISLNKIWFSPKERQYFYLPAGMAIPAGNFSIEDLNGTKTEADYAFIQPYLFDHETIQHTLQTSFQASLQYAKNEFLELVAFTHHRKGEKADQQFYTDLFAQMISESLGTATRTGFHPDKKGPSLFNLDDLDLPQHLEDLLPNQAQQEDFKVMVDRLRDIAVQLDKSVLDKGDDPEVWIKVLDEHFFGKSNARKEEKEKERMRTSISQSIAEGLRKQGITPAEDLKAGKK